MYKRPLVPDDFPVPRLLQTASFRLRPLTIHDVIKDYDAVMESVTHLKGLMTPTHDWPVGLTIEEDLVDLGWHQREFTLRHSFAYTVMSLDDSRCLGCCYIYPPEDPAFDADAFYWARRGELAGGLEEQLGATFRDWLAEKWPFRRVAYPGRGEPFIGRYLTGVSRLMT
jgi:hypothetical protein